MTLEPKVAVITGASRGIGAALLRAYRDLGYHVVASSRSIGKSHDGPGRPRWVMKDAITPAALGRPTDHKRLSSPR